jgi:hypothetical protein
MSRKIEFSKERAFQIVRGNDERYRRIENIWIDEKKGIDTIRVIVQDNETGLYYKTTYKTGRKWTTGDVFRPFDREPPVFIEVKPKIIQKTVWEETQEEKEEIRPQEEPKPQNPAKGRQPPKWDTCEEIIKAMEKINREFPDEEPLKIPKKPTEH